MKRFTDEELDQEAARLEQELPQEFADTLKILDKQAIATDEIADSLAKLQQVDDEEAHEKFAGFLEKVFLNARDDMFADIGPKAKEIKTLVQLFGGIAQMMGGLDDDPDAREMVDAVHAMGYVAKYVYDVKGAATEADVAVFLQKLGELSDDQYNDPMALTMVVLDLAEAHQARAKPANPFRPQP